VYERLRRLVGVGAAAFFADAVRMLQGPAPASFDPGTDGEDRAGGPPDRLETASHLIGHCMREVESAVRKLLISGIGLPPKPKKKKSNVKAGAAATPPDETHLREVKAILTDFGIPLGAGPALFWIDLATKSSKQGLHRRAHRSNQGPPRPVEAELRGAWDSFLGLLEVLLDEFEGRYTASVYQRLDRLAAIIAPTDFDVSELKQLPYTDATHRYFFSKVASPEWLPKLKDAGFFDHPPEPVQEAEGFRFPPWPQADYLARMAPNLPTTVREIIESVQTSNTSVQWQLVEIARVLPLDDVLKLVPTVRSWVPWLRRFEFVDPLLQYIKALSDGGYGNEAVAVLADFYGVRGQAK
jgi:hypothetical protein